LVKYQKLFIKKAELIGEDFRGLSGHIYKISSDGIIVTCGTNHDVNQALKITEIFVNDLLLILKIILKNYGLL